MKTDQTLLYTDRVILYAKGWLAESLPDFNFSRELPSWFGWMERKKSIQELKLLWGRWYVGFKDLASLQIEIIQSAITGSICLIRLLFYWKFLEFRESIIEYCLDWGRTRAGYIFVLPVSNTDRFVAAKKIRE